MFVYYKMTSLSEDAYVGTLHYKFLDPPVGITPGGENLQQTCDIGNTTTTDIITSNGDFVATTGSFKAPIGIFEGIGVEATGNIETTNGNIETQTGKIEAITGNIEATAGNITCVAGTIAGVDLVAGDTIVATGAITTSNGNFVATNGKAEIEGNITSKSGNFTADLKDFVATAGNVRASVGRVEGQQIKMSNFDSANTSQVAPQRPPFVAPNLPDLTNKTKGAYWVYNPASTLIQFIIETGIVDCVLNATTFISFNQYNTATPRELVSYRIGQVDISGADRSKLVISCEFDGIVPSTDPVRVCIAVYPD